MSASTASDRGLHVEVEAVSRVFTRTRRGLFGPKPTVKALDGVSLRVKRGDAVGIVGESGSGKTTLMRLILGLDHPTTGTVRVSGTVVTGRDHRDLGWLRREAQLVFQDPFGSLDPRMRVGDSVAEPLRGLRIGDEDQRRSRVLEVLDAVGLSAEAAQRYPHQFSGGQRQRIAVARALAPRPRLLIADEPVSALDVSVRAQVLRLLADIARDSELTLIIVSHDLGVIRYLCHEVTVLRAGRIVESGPTDRIYTDPQTDYTRRLLAAAGIGRTGSG